MATGETVDGILNQVNGAMFTPDPTIAVIPAAFFKGRHLSLPFPGSRPRGKAFQQSDILSDIRKKLPAHPGDLLWLVDCFIQHSYLGGGNVDFAAASEHEFSVWRKVMG
jgi:hypothetical protein